MNVFSYLTVTVTSQTLQFGMVDFWPYRGRNIAFTMSETINPAVLQKRHPEKYTSTEEQMSMLARS